MVNLLGESVARTGYSVYLGNLNQEEKKKRRKREKRGERDWKEKERRMGKILEKEGKESVASAKIWWIGMYQVWRRSNALQATACPYCRQRITIILPYFSQVIKFCLFFHLGYVQLIIYHLEIKYWLNHAVIFALSRLLKRNYDEQEERDSADLAEIEQRNALLTEVHTYNRRYSGEPRTLLEMIRSEKFNFFLSKLNSQRPSCAAEAPGSLLAQWRRLTPCFSAQVCYITQFINLNLTSKKTSSCLKSWKLW